MWTIHELGERVEAALSTDYEGPASGRIRAVPDSRTIRYYTTLGLIDRPAAMRGRTALYGPRHLQQIVAIKRLQAEGLTLQQVQQRLAGVAETDLADIARVEEIVEAEGPPPPAAPARARAFWKQAAAEADESEQELPSAALRQALDLAPGVTVVFGGDRTPSDRDAAALLRAATPLIEEMQARGLLGPHNGKDGDV